MDTGQAIYELTFVPEDAKAVSHPLIPAKTNPLRRPGSVYP